MANVPCSRDPRCKRFFRGASALVYWVRLDLNRLDYSDRLIVRAIAGHEPRADDGDGESPAVDVPDCSARPSPRDLE